MKRRNFLKSIGLCGAASCLPMVLAAARKKRKPNIIYINVDDMGWRDLGYTGRPEFNTPNIDKLSREGMVFSQAYAPAANCAPSRACCMSGQYTPRHGIYTVGSSKRGKSRNRKLIPVKNNQVLPEKIITIAEALKPGGYKSISIGKWHIGKDPKTQGFDENVGGNMAGHPRSYFSPFKNKDLPDGPKGEYLPRRLTDEAISFLKRNKDRPFFLYFPYYSVHAPLQAPKELITENKKEKGVGNPVYRAMIEGLDRNIGRLLKAVDTLKLRENTFVLFTSDNGGVFKFTSNAPLRAGKGSYFEGGIREPMIVRWPGKVKAGSKCNIAVHGIDFYPTFIEVAGIKKPRGKLLDGLSIVPLLTGKRSFPRRPLFWHFPIYLQGGNKESRDPEFRTRPGSVIRFGKWKLHEYFEDGALLLYNLDEDIGEQNNLAEKYPEKVKELHKMLREWRKKTNAPVPVEFNPEYRP